MKKGKQARVWGPAANINTDVASLDYSKNDQAATGDGNMEEDHKFVEEQVIFLCFLH